MSVARADVRQIEHVLRRAKKAKFAAYGTGVGAGVGFGVGAANAQDIGDDGAIYYIVSVPVAMGIGAAVGALVGISRRKRVVIYEAAGR